jgi:hypothetical protein
VGRKKNDRRRSGDREKKRLALKNSIKNVIVAKMKFK